MSKENFKNFVKNHPELASHVMNNKASWQQFMNYMIYMEKIIPFGITT